MQTVIFEQNRDGGVMARYNRKIAFPARGGVQPQVGDEYEVVATTQNARGTCYFLALGRRISTAAERDAASRAAADAQEAERLAAIEAEEAERESRRAAGIAWLPVIERELRAEGWHVEQEDLPPWGTTLRVFAVETGLRWPIVSLNWQSHATYQPVAAEYAEQQRQFAPFFAIWRELRDDGHDLHLSRNDRSAVFAYGDNRLAIDRLAPPADHAASVRNLVAPNNALSQRIQALIAPVGGHISVDGTTATLKVGDLSASFSMLRSEQAAKAEELAAVLADRYAAYQAARTIIAQLQQAPLRVRGFTDDPLIADDRLPAGKAVSVLADFIDPAVLCRIEALTLCFHSVQAQIRGDELVLFRNWKARIESPASLSSDEMILHPATSRDEWQEHVYLRLPVMLL
jgi:hypothetical protein